MLSEDQIRVTNENDLIHLPSPLLEIVDEDWGTLSVHRDRLTPQVLSDRLLSLTMKEIIDLQLILAKEGVEFIISPGTVQIEQTI